jgi:hypothetical protein
MAFADDLLALGQEIANLRSETRRQANLRRSVFDRLLRTFPLADFRSDIELGRPGTPADAALRPRPDVFYLRKEGSRTGSWVSLLVGPEPAESRLRAELPAPQNP